MKVVIVGTAHPYRGGLAAYNHRLAYEYLSQGCEVEIITFTLQYPNFLFPGKSQYSDEDAPNGLTIRRMINAINPFNWVKVGRYIKRQKPDMVITKYWLPFMAPCLGTINHIAKSKDTRRVAILDNLIPHEHRIGDRTFTHYFVGAVDGMVAMSRSVLADADIFDKHHRIPRAFCPHPLYDHYGEILPREEALRLLELPTEERYILFFGLIRDYKGLDLLIEAMADKRIRQSNIRLIVAGEFYNDSTPYMEQIDQLGLGKKIVMHTHFIPDSEVARYFSAADIVAQPYKSATQSGVTQIAYHFEKPMLVTNVGGLAEIVPDGKVGLVVEPTSKDIADGLVRYFDGKMEQQMREGVREEKQKYLWSNLTTTIEKLFTL